MPLSSAVPAKRKACDVDLQQEQQQSPPQQHRKQAGSGSLTGSAFQANGTSVPVMTANDAASTVFSELTGFHSGSWLIEMQKLHNANRRLRHELSALRKRSTTSIVAAADTHAAAAAVC